jgi:hypothetical protein
MFTLRREQKRALIRAWLATKIDYFTRAARVQAPEATARLGQDELRERVCSALDRAAELGIEGGAPATAFVQLSLEWGEGFSELPWAASVIRGQGSWDAKAPLLLLASGTARDAAAAPPAGTEPPEVEQPEPTSEEPSPTRGA